MFSGQYNLAISDYDKAIRLKPDFVTAYGNRGEAKRLLCQYDAAIIDCNEAIRLKPDYPNVYATRGRARVHLGDIEGAKFDFQTALELAKQQGEENLEVRMKQQIENFAMQNSYFQTEKLFMSSAITETSKGILVFGHQMWYLAGVSGTTFI